MDTAQDKKFAETFKGDLYNYITDLTDNQNKQIDISKIARWEKFKHTIKIPVSFPKKE
jgi:hypothetical protein